MAKAATPSQPAPTHDRLKVKSPIVAAGTQFNPGVRYTVKAAVFDAIKAVAIEVAPLVKE